MRKVLIVIFAVIAGLYIALCGILYFVQEKLIFFPEKLPANYQFSFNDPFEEINIATDDGTLLNGLLFKSKDPKGLIFYLHGNAGSLRSWAGVAKTYTDLQYDVFIVDYRGYGKSSGTIKSQQQLFADNETLYREMLKRYDESRIIVLGYSIGSGLAARLASTHKPRLLILQAPYYSLTDVMKHMFPVVPAFILKYKLVSWEYLKACTMPVVIFHGDQDEVIYYGSSLKLAAEFKKQDKLITLKGQGHNGMTENPDYLAAIRSLLGNE